MSEESTDVETLGGETQPVNPSTPETEFTVPDEYKDAGWAKNIHSVGDLWSQHANAQHLIGRKTIGIPTSDSSEQEYIDFYSKTRPESQDGYDFDLEDDSDNAMFKELFYNNGISARQAKSLIDGYKDSIRKNSEVLYSAEGFETTMKNELGNEYKDRLDEINKFLKVNARPSQLDALENAPNEILGLVYGLINKTMDKYAVKELGAAEQKPVNASSSVDSLTEYMKEKSKLEQNPFTTTEQLEDLKRRYGVGKYVKG